jgi:hypothetical protein
MSRHRRSLARIQLKSIAASDDLVIAADSSFDTADESTSSYSSSVVEGDILVAKEMMDACAGRR